MKASEFKKYLLEQVNNHSLYIWGGQGENLDRMNFQTIREMETSPSNVAKVLDTYASYLQKGFDMSKAKAFDCSGLAVYFLMSNNIINSDMTADGLYKICKPVDIKSAREGDFVVKNKTNKGTWGHIGYVVNVDGNLKVVEAKGRAYGVVISTLDSWLACGRPSFWDAEFVFNRKLKLGCTGDDVQALQKMLVAKGYKVATVGNFGKKTDEVIRDFQEKNGLVIDGIAGQKTIIKLGGIWE